ncbi:MAG: hypothetical protein IKD76_05945 [Clostridia bacterium]|nr:hypothetical protein [Clostridia bacterium]
MEEHGLTIVKDNFLNRLTTNIRRFFFKGKIKNLVVDNDNPRIKFIMESNNFVQQEILDARRAYRKYVINNQTDISRDVFSYLRQKIVDNESRIRHIIKINKDNISYEDILYLLENEEKNINKYKTRNKKNGYYNVPIGVIGLECSGSIDSIKGIFRAISTRNAIIILHNNYNEYSTESLILMIAKECLKSFYIDNNIVQMFERQEIDLSKLDKLITENGKVRHKNLSHTIYLYQEDNEFSDAVQDEISRLTSTEMYKSYKVETINGDFGNVIGYLNEENPPAVCMYTNNPQKAYKFINWVKAPNVFVNTGIKNCMEAEDKISEFFNSKYVSHEDVF